MYLLPVKHVYEDIYKEREGEGYMYIYMCVYIHICIYISI